MPVIIGITRQRTLNDTDGDGVADPGETFDHVVIIQNTGDTDATDVVDSESENGYTINPASVLIGPIAFDDGTFSITGNTPMRFEVAQLLGNDSDPDGLEANLHITAVAGAVGGTVVLNDNGTAGNFADDFIIFTPTTGLDVGANASFTYAIVDEDGIASVATTPGTVRMTITEVVWYVDKNAAPGGDGSFTNPFTNLTELNGVTGDGTTGDDVDSAGETIFIYDRANATNGANDATGGIVLEASQKLFGDGHAFSANGLTIGATANNSTIHFNGAGVTLAGDNQVRGLDLVGQQTTSVGIVDGNATVGNLTVSATNISGQGQIIDIDQGGALNVTLTGASSTGSTVNNGGVIDLGNTGTLTGSFTVTGTTTITGTHGQTAIDIGAAGTNLAASFSGGTTLSMGAQAGVNLGTNAGSTTFAGIDVTTTTGAAFTANGAGTLTITGTGNDIVTTTGTALNLSSVTVGNGLANGVEFATVTTNGAANGIQLASVAQGANSTGIDVLGGAIVNASTRGVDIDATSADVAVASTISTTATGRSVEVTNSGRAGGSGSTIIFSGAIDDNGLGINLDNNDQNTNGASISFTGGLDIDSTVNTGFNAINGGTVTVTGSTNTIDTTTATALNIVNTNIGAGDATFRSISSNGGSAAGIILDTTGSAGGLHVIGNGTDDSGGTIANKTGANGSTTTGVGIYANNTAELQLNLMQLNGFDNFAIRGADINGFTLSNSDINGNNGNDGGFDEGAIFLANSSGTINITGNQISGGFEDNLRVLYDSATADTATYNITGNAFTDLQGGNNAMINLFSTTAASASSNITFNIGDPTNAALGNTFDNSANQNPSPPPATQWFGDGILVTFEGPFQHNINIDNNTFFELFQAIDFAANFSADVNGRIYSNDITFTEGAGAIAFGTGSSSTAAMLFQMLVEDNVIGGLGNNSGSRLGNGIVGDFRGAETARVTIHQNSVQDTEVNPINIISQSTVNAQTHLRITNNTVNSIDDDVGGGAGPIPAVNVVTNTSTNGDIYLTLTGNNLIGLNEQGVVMRQASADNTFQIEDLTPAAGATQAQVEAFLEGLNTSSVRIRTVSSVVQYTAMNFNNTNTPAPFTPMLVGQQPEEPQPPAVGNGSGKDNTGGDHVTDDIGNTNPVFDSPRVADGNSVPAPADPIFVDDGVLSQAELDFLVDAAIDRWAAADATREQLEAMRAVVFSVTDMSGLYLGLSAHGIVQIDSDGAGHGWFLDRTPGGDSEFSGSGGRMVATADGGAAGRMDLLTVLMHELGHQIGIDDTYRAEQTNELMYGYAFVGERRTPDEQDLQGADPSGVGHTSYVLSPITIGGLPQTQAVQVVFTSTVNSFTNAMIPTTITNASTVTFRPPDLPSAPGSTTSAAESLVIDTLTLGSTVFVDSNTNGFFDAGEGINGVTLTLFADTNNNGSFDEGVDQQVFADNNFNGVFDAGDTLATATTATVLGVAGTYSFANLGPGNYIVRVDATNFAGPGVLSGKLGIAGGNDPDDNADNDDNGVAGPSGSVVSQTITLAYGTEPTSDGGATPKNDINNTLDFGFFAPNLEPTLTATAVNPTFNENGGSVDLFSGVTVSAVEAGQTITSATLTVTNVTEPAEERLTIDGALVVLSNGNSGTTATNALAFTVTLVGSTATIVLTKAGGVTPAVMGTVLDGLTYSHAGNDPTDANRVVTVTELVDSGPNSPSPSDNTATLNVASTVNVEPINDPPSGTNATILMAEDAARILNAIDFGFTDPLDNDAFSGLVVTTLPTAGQLRVNGTPITLAGTVVPIGDINGNLLTYHPALNASGLNYSSFTFQVRDDGGTANGGLNTDQSANSITFDVSAVNDAPVNSVTGATQTFNEDSSLTFNAANLNLISVSDVDAGANDVQATLAIQSGALTLNAAAVGALTSVTGDGTNNVVLTGTVAEINAALNGLVYNPGANNNGNRTLTITTNDLGNSGADPGAGGTGTLANELDSDDISVNVLSVNDEPSGTDDSSSTPENLAYTFTATDFTVGFSDPLDGNAFFAVKITALPALAGGVLKLNGSAIGAGDTITLAQLAGGQFTFEPAAGSASTSPTFTFQVRDDGGIANGGVDLDQTPNTFTINVGAPNASPVLDLDDTNGGTGSSASYTENDPVAVLLAPNAIVSDADGATLAGATVTINAVGFQAGQDRLSIGGLFSGTISGITFSFSNVTGAMTLTGTASLADYQAVLRQVRFDSLAENPSASRAINWIVNDGFSSSAVANTSLAFTAVEDPATANDDNIFTDELNATSGTLMADNGHGADIDLDGPAFLITAVNGSPLVSGSTITLPSGALLTLDDLGNFIYDPNGAFDATPVAGSGASNTPAVDSFTYTITGGDTATVVIAISGFDGDDVLLGTSGADNLAAGGGDDFTDGLGGADGMAGGLGNDRYAVDDKGDEIVENDGEGNDVVYALASYQLGAGVSVEILSSADQSGTTPLVLVGNAQDQEIYGNAGDNFLEGGGGLDFLIGFGGNDAYVIEGGDDVVVEEDVGGGNDVVYTRSDYALNGDAEVEVLSTVDQSATTPTSLIGNGFDQQIYGNAGANFLSGGGGADLLVGLGGNDVYVVDSADDFVAERTGGGTDIVLASVSYTLGAVERVEILSTIDQSATTAIDLTGNNVGQHIYGNAGSNVLDGGLGADALIGLGGADSFAFTTLLGAGNVDSIADFVSGLDRILLDDAAFSGLAPGVLAASAFALGPAAADADDRIVYDQATGRLLFDADGSGGGAAVLFATVQPGTAITAADFSVI